MRHRIESARRAGFTLVEVLVTLVLIALLVGVIVPAVVNQLNRGDPTRTISDLEGIRNGIKMFRIDVKRYPSNLQQLVVDPCLNDSDTACEQWGTGTENNALPSGEINVNLRQLWSGPYVEGLDIDNVTAVETALGAEIQPDFTQNPLRGVTYLVIRVDGLTEADVATIDAEFDNDNTSTGRIQRTGTDDDDDVMLHFFAVPLN